MSPHDQYLLLLYLESYIDCQRRVRLLYLDQESGMTTEEVEFEKLNPSRTPEGICQANPAIREVMDSIAHGAFSRGDKKLFQPLVETLMSPHDQYLLLLDLESYIDCQRRVRLLYLDQESWTKKSILNVARMGKFSTDRTIRQYSEEIWGIPVE